MSLLTEPLAYGFFTRALAGAVLIGALCGALSVFVVLRRMSYIGHGLAHSVLGGVAVGVALGYDPYVGAVAATLLSAVLIDRVARRRGLHVDAAIGIVTTAMFALGIAVVSAAGSTRVNTEAVLFGNVIGVTRTDLLLAAAVAVGFAAALLRWYKPLLFTTFDAEVAQAQGVRVGLTELALNVLTAAVVIVSVRLLGVLLVAAAVVIPAATARLLSRSFGRLLVLATVLGVLASVTGLYVSFHVAVASGPAIVLTGAATFAVLFVATMLAQHARGIRTRRALVVR